MVGSDILSAYKLVVASLFLFQDFRCHPFNRAEMNSASQRNVAQIFPFQESGHYLVDDLGVVARTRRLCVAVADRRLMRRSSTYNSTGQQATKSRRPTESWPRL